MAQPSSSSLSVSPPRGEMLSRLRDEIAAIERKPALMDSEKPRLGERAGMPQVPAGSSSEVFADQLSGSAAALGFALMQARGLMAPGRQAILWLQLCHEGQEAGLLYPPGLVACGLDPERLVIGRTGRIEDLLWVIEEALGCPALSAVIADVPGFHKLIDFTVSRRLSLRAQGAGVGLFMLRQGREREASAAGFRFHVTPLASHGARFDHKAPGPARMRVTLEKGQLGAGLKGSGTEWVLDWVDNGFANSSDDSASRTGAGEALSGASPAGLGDRLPETG